MNDALLVGCQTASHFHRKAVLAAAGMGMDRFVGGTDRGFVVESSHRHLRTDCNFNPHLYDTFSQNKPNDYNLKYEHSRHFARYSACQMQKAKSCHVRCFNKYALQ